MGNLGTVISSLGDRGNAASSTGSINAKVAQMLANIPSGGLTNGTQGVPIWYPSVADGIYAAGSATPWAAGAWQQIVAASVLTGHCLIAVMAGNINVNMLGAQLEIGEGGAGAEVAKYKMGAGLGEFQGNGNQISYLVPPLKITANARVAVRGYCTLGSNQMVSWYIFAPRPL